ncbi:MAG: hypothetical protein ABEH64_07670 [Salinirussus sp.]
MPDAEALYEQLCENDQSDGLPVIPPTDERVAAALDEVDRAGDEVIFAIPTSFADLTVESLASCAVMAGCKPAYFPVVLAAAEGMAEWPNLEAVKATTGGYDTAIIVNGPIREDLDINCGTGLFGPGYRANATIGRAMSLAFLTVGGVYPDRGTKATHTFPGRYTFCFGEREGTTNWDPLHTDLAGLDPDENAVTVVTAHAPHLLSEGAETRKDVVEVAKVLGHGAAAPGTAGAADPGEIVFVLGQDHAGRLAEDCTKREAKELLYEHTTLPYSEQKMLGSPEDALIVTAGGIGNNSIAIHTMTFAGNEAVTTPIRN